MICPSCGTENIEGNDRCENCLASFRQLDIPSIDAAEGLARSVMEDTLSELDQEETIRVSPDTPALEVAALMKGANQGCALVMDGAKLVGIFTEHDVLLKMTTGTGALARPSGRAQDELVKTQDASHKVRTGSASGQPAWGGGSDRVDATDTTRGSSPTVREGSQGQAPDPMFNVQSPTPDTRHPTPDRDRALLVKDLMSRNPETLHERDSVAEAVNRMSLGRYRHLPVKKSDGTYTVTSIKAVLNYIAQEDW